MDDDGSGPRQGLSDLYALHDEALVRHLAGAHSPSAPAMTIPSSDTNGGGEYEVTVTSTHLLI